VRRQLLADGLVVIQDADLAADELRHTDRESVGARARIIEGAAWLGLRLDTAANPRGPGIVSAADSAVAALVLRTGEEAVIAGHTARLTGVGVG